MPLFEFRCSSCRAKFTQLIGMTADSRDPSCPKCGGTEVTKLVSRFMRLRSDDERLDSFEDVALTADPDDPRAMSRLMREMGREIADEDGEEDFEEFIDEAEREMYDGETSEQGPEAGDELS